MANSALAFEANVHYIHLTPNLGHRSLASRSICQFAATRAALPLRAGREVGG
jgi:hypothetical protein